MGVKTNIDRGRMPLLRVRRGFRRSGSLNCRAQLWATENCKNEDAAFFKPALRLWSKWGGGGFDPGFTDFHRGPIPATLDCAAAYTGFLKSEAG